VTSDTDLCYRQVMYFFLCQLRPEVAEQLPRAKHYLLTYSMVQSPS